MAIFLHILLFFGPFLLFSYLFILVGTSSSRQHKNQKNWINVKGKVIGYKISENISVPNNFTTPEEGFNEIISDSTTYSKSIVYKYTTLDNKTFNSENNSFISDDTSNEVVNVFYNPNKPMESDVDIDKKSSGAGVFYILGILTLLIGILLNIYVF